MSESKSLPAQPLALDKHGTLRFVPNAIVRDMLDFSTPKGFDMNRIAMHNYSREDRVQFAQLIGYSLCGFGDLSYVSDVDYETAETLFENPTIDPKDAKIAALEATVKNLNTTLRGIYDTLQNLPSSQLEEY